ncbi:MAG: polyketide synthase, partial [bacterium]|nr:polyketide synthase [bacterium]
MSRDPRPTKPHGPAQGGGEGGTPREPIAVVGIGCRFPGARDARAFWRLLRDGVDAVTEVPRERFDVDAVFDPRPGVPGKTYSRWGGFLADVDRFDAGFFGISPREAAGLDPQQRLVLELAWEAFEDAGQVPAELAGSPSGVFLGLGPEDYLARGLRRTSAIDLYLATGGSRGTAAGRVAHA